MRIRFCLNGTISRPIALLPTNIIKSIALNIDKPEECVKPVEGRPLIFKVVKEGIVLRPLYDIHRERFVVYWDVK